MNTRRFSEAMTALNDRYIDEALAAQAQTTNAPFPKKKRIWQRLAVLAACVLLIFGGGQLLQGTKEKEVPVITHMEAHEENGLSMSSSSSYPVPKPGTLLFETAVREARHAYRSDHVQFMVRIDISDANQTHLTGEALVQEYRRLQEAGIALYTVEHWHYQGHLEKVPLYTVVACLTEDQLAHFPINATYGYFFDFPTNGDGSPVDAGSRVPLDFNES